MIKIKREDFLTQVIRKWIKINENKKLKKNTKTTFKFRKSLIKKLFSLKIIKLVAPIITGMLKRFEYLTVKFLLNPNERRAIILAPALLTPGIKARHWKKPVNKASLKFIASWFLTMRQYLSKMNKITAKITLV